MDPPFLWNFNSPISFPSVSFFPPRPPQLLSQFRLSFPLFETTQLCSYTFPHHQPSLWQTLSRQIITYKLQSAELAHWLPTCSSGWVHVFMRDYKAFQALLLHFFPFFHASSAIFFAPPLCMRPILPGISWPFPYLIPICLSRFCWIMIWKRF